MRKVVIIGGAGTVGQIITKNLNEKYKIAVLDKNITQKNDEDYFQVDATNYQDLISKVPKDTDVIINLLKTDTSAPVEEVNKFNKMTDVFFNATYYILLVASYYKIPKVIFASSNHVTDYYEKDGDSTLGREITTNDYPCTKGLYGVLKLASEQLGFIFSLNRNMSVLNLRIGSVPSEVEQKAVGRKSRLKKTLLTEVDVIGLFTAAIESTKTYGTYYGVSNNPEKPWDTSNAATEIGFKSAQNVMDIL